MGWGGLVPAFGQEKDFKLVVVKCLRLCVFRLRFWWVVQKTRKEGDIDGETLREGNPW